MTRKRGQPDRSRRKKKRKKSLLGRLVRIAGAVIARHPSVAGGTAAFLVIFSFVSANAVWYQPGAIQHPLFVTRDRQLPPAASKPHIASKSSSDLTIEEVIAGLPADAHAATRAPDAGQTASIPAPATRAAPPAPAAPAADPLIKQIQAALADRQFYLGPIDGADDDKTRAAIEAFQAATDRPLTGKASADLLAAIRATHRDAVAIPRSRPGIQPPSADDEVAAVLARSQPANVPVPTARRGDQPAGNLVARIQTGLRNIAYSNVAVDGIAGAATKAAIRNFEKNYRLPETGEPSRRVLDKLIAIGAL